MTRDSGVAIQAGALWSAAMAEPGSQTYERLLRQLIDDGAIRPDDSVFVQFAGEYDELICKSVGLTNCTFGNIAPDSASGLAAAGRFDAHRMPYPDGAFDHVIGHAGLHHCSRPHEALHEMYRIARRVVLFVENQESPLMRLAARAGVVGSYEHAAVRGHGGTGGGVDGTAVPNFVYRWTRREVTKAVRSFDPGQIVPLEFHAEWNFATRFGTERVSTVELRRRLGLGARAMPAVQRLLNGVARGQGNIFAVAIRKDLAMPQPWMSDRGEDRP